jgi:hypothetical protein
MLDDKTDYRVVTHSTTRVLRPSIRQAVYRGMALEQNGWNFSAVNRNDAQGWITSDPSRETA